MPQSFRDVNIFCALDGRLVSVRIVRSFAIKSIKPSYVCYAPQMIMAVPCGRKNSEIFFLKFIRYIIFGPGCSISLSVIFIL